METFLEGDDSTHAALALDHAIIEHIARKDRNLAADYLALGRCLAEMQATRAFKLVGYPTFEGYLKVRPAFGRTYYSYLIKLGRAKNLEPLPPGIGGAQLVEYVKATPFPDKVGDLILETWETVKDLPVRQMAPIIRAYVDEHAEAYRGSDKPERARKQPTIVRRVAHLLERLGPDERRQLVESLDDLLEAHRSHRAPERQQPKHL